MSGNLKVSGASFAYWPNLWHNLINVLSNHLRTSGPSSVNALELGFQTSKSDGGSGIPRSGAPGPEDFSEETHESVFLKTGLKIAHLAIMTAAAS